MKIINKYPGIRGYVIDKMIKGEVYAALSNLRKLGLIVGIKDGGTLRYYKIE